ncbi:MAG: hypothetical protein ACM3L6_01805 [Deltaproteobacteria bacterium]
MVFQNRAWIKSGMVLMFGLLGCSGVPFEKYVSRDPMLGVSMSYPKGWQYRESRGAYGSYADVMFYPEAKDAREARAMMALTVEKDPKLVSLDAAAKDLIAKRMKFKGAQVLAQANRNVLGASAAVIDFSYQKPEDLLDVRSGLALFKERVVVFHANGMFAFFRYESKAEDFDRYLPFFRRMVASLKSSRH